jgi:alpha-N-arabinofuranosidase
MVATRSRIRIDVDQVIGEIDNKIYGGFIEHLGRCIYGGIYEEGSRLSDEHGFRQDVLSAAHDLKIPILRWPGGNFASGYHWIDGIGPKETRPARFDLAWRDEECNRFGTDEFMEYCRALGTEPYLCVNLGTGTIEEAAAWVEYCNGAGNTYYANLRRKHGFEEPYNVKYWGLGNEMYGPWQVGAKNAEDYSKIAIEAAKLMKRVDPRIKLVSCGADGLSDWDRIVLEALAPWVDYHSIHIYTGDKSYYPNVFSPHHAERCIRLTEAMIEQTKWKLKLEKSIFIAIDEWNQVYGFVQTGMDHEYKYSLGDALAVATYLNIFQRNAGSVKMANLAQMVNVLAPIFTGPRGLYLQTIYHPLYLYANHSQPIALETFVDSPKMQIAKEEFTFNKFNPEDQRIWELNPFQLLDVSATADENRSKLSLAVVNRALEEDVTTDIQIIGADVKRILNIYEINASDVSAMNSFESPESVSITKKPTGANSNEKSLEYVFPAHSLSFLEVELQRHKNYD